MIFLDPYMEDGWNDDDKPENRITLPMKEDKAKNKHLN